MGDCRIRIVIAKSLLSLLPQSDVINEEKHHLPSTNGTGNVSDNIILQSQQRNSSIGTGTSIHVVANDDNQVLSTVNLYSADTTIREVIEGNTILWKLYSFYGTASGTNQLQSSSTSTSTSSSSSLTVPIVPFNLWDCTLHPPQNITTWPLNDYPNLSGPKSLTLHSAGWFPSGTLLAIPSSRSKDSTDNHDETDYDDDDDNVQLLSQWLHPPGSGTTGSVYDDVQYNTIRRNNNSTNSHINNQATRVEFKSSSFNQAQQQQQHKQEHIANLPLPSQVMASVANRFRTEGDSGNNNKSHEEEEAIALRRRNKQQRIEKEQQRMSKLEQRIAILEQQQLQNKKTNNEETTTRKNSNNNNKPVSDQVLKMLIKSRATGDTNLKMRDRIYFQSLLLFDDIDDDNDNDGVTRNNGPSSTGKVYRYFSPQDTFAKIANTFGGRDDDSINKNNSNKEVLCRVQKMKRTTSPLKEQDNQGPISRPNNVEGTIIDCYVYRRFPMAMRVYEAISDGYLTNDNDSSQVNTLIVRWYKHPHDATPSILEQEQQQNDDDDDDNSIVEGVDTPVEPYIPITDDMTAIEEGSLPHDMTGDGCFEDSTLLEAISVLDGTKGKKSSSSSAAIVKVRQMKMKSKAKGDTKRIPKAENRFFLEVVVVERVSNNGTDGGRGGGINVTSDYYFMARTDPLGRILQYVVLPSGSSGSTTTTATTVTEEWEFLVLQDDGKFRPVRNVSVSLEEAEDQGIIKSFDRIILRPSKTPQQQP